MTPINEMKYHMNLSYTSYTVTGTDLFAVIVVTQVISFYGLSHGDETNALYFVLYTLYLLGLVLMWSNYNAGQKQVSVLLCLRNNSSIMCTVTFNTFSQ